MYAKVCEESNCSLQEVCLKIGSLQHVEPLNQHLLPPDVGLRRSLLQPEFGAIACCSKDSDQYIC